jgi:tetratricopeptide (TPR) repeat protein
VLEVMPVPPIDPDEFVSLAKPPLERRDLPGLLALCKARWTKEQIISLLSSPHDDARKVAALALSLVGCKACVRDLSERLKDPDPMVNQMAEHALWSIWFRSGESPEANHQLCRGTQAINRREFEHAVRHFDRAIELDPSFAEAYNQRAIARYLQEQYERSIEDCQAAVERMPCHFGAWAGLGHCYAHQGQLDEAVESYRRALDINPHMDEIRQFLESLRGGGDES